MEGILVTISAKLFWSLTTCFWHRCIRETGHASRGHAFWRVKLVLAIFVERCPVITWPPVSEENIFLSFRYRDKPCTWWPCFWRIKFILAISVEGHPGIIPGKRRSKLLRADLDWSEHFVLVWANIGITHVFSCINICYVWTRGR